MIIIKFQLILLIVILTSVSGCLDEDPRIQEAIDAGDPSLCDVIESSSDQRKCYQKVAASENDPSICNSYFSDSSSVDSCIMFVAVENENPDGCNLASSNDVAENCVKAIAEDTYNPTLCERLSDTGKKDNCYRNIAVETDDSSLCLSVGESRKKDECYVSIATRTNDHETCDLVGESRQADSCFNTIAQRTENPDLCNRISENDMGLLCYGRLTGDSSVCEGISGSYDRDNCYSGAGMRASNPSDCEMVESSSLRNGCYSSVAVSEGDASLCEHVDYESSKNGCIVNVASSTNDRSLCNDITDEGYRNSCIQQTNTGEQNETSPADEEESETDVDEENAEGVCKYDNECPSICEGDTMWKQGCDPRTDECIKIFDGNDCTEIVESIASFGFGQVCTSGACVRNYAAIESKRNELILEDEGLSQEAFIWQNNVQSLRNTERIARDNCLSVLSDVTNLLIIKSALTIVSAMSAVKAPDLSTGTVQNPVPLLGEGTNNFMGIVDAATSNSSRMSPEEYIAANCKLVSSDDPHIPTPIGKDIINMEKKLQNTNDNRRTIQQQIEDLNTALQ